MISRLFYSSLLVTLLFCVSGCKTEVEVELFASDLFDKMENFEADAELLIQIPGEDWIDEEKNRNRLSTLITPYFGEMGELSTKSVEFDTFCVVPIKVPVFTETGKFKVFALTFDPTEDGMEVACWMNPKWFQSFKEAIRKELMTSINVEDVEFRINLNNDTGGAMEVVGNSVYLGDIPAAFEGTTILEHREDVLVTVSKIHLSAIYEAGVASNSPGNSRVLVLRKE